MLHADRSFVTLRLISSNVLPLVKITSTPASEKTYPGHHPGHLPLNPLGGE